MRAEDFEIVIIEDKRTGTYCAYPKSEKLSGLVVQVENINDVPKEIARSFEAFLQMAFDKKMYTINIL